MSGKESNHSQFVEEPNSENLKNWMYLAAPDSGGYERITSQSLLQRFALEHYIRMVEVDRVTSPELCKRITEDAITYIEESVLRMKLGHRYFQFRDGDMYSDKYGTKSLLSMCRDAVVAREKLGIDAHRARHEGLGVSNLLKLLSVMSTGETVMIISPPDDKDKNMSDYSMMYVYEKQENEQIWFGAVRDEQRTIQDWQNFAKANSLWQTDWEAFDHLRFVAMPIVGKDSLGSILKNLGVADAVGKIPEWMEREAESSARLIASNIAHGNIDIAQRVLDAFKIVVTTGRKQTNKEDVGYSVSRMLMDNNYAWMLHRMFRDNGGQQLMSSGGLCGADQLMTQWGDNANPRNQYLQDNNSLSQLMGIDEKGVASTESSSTMKCVECPFCHKTVDAIVTSTKIKCPECKVEVSKG